MLIDFILGSIKLELCSPRSLGKLAPVYLAISVVLCQSLEVLLTTYGKISVGYLLSAISRLRMRCAVLHFLFLINYFSNLRLRTADVAAATCCRAVHGALASALCITGTLIFILHCHLRLCISFCNRFLQILEIHLY